VSKRPRTKAKKGGKPIILPQAFAAIAAELRTQYLLGYYPGDRTKDGGYHAIKVKTSRKDIAIRARPGYRARTGE